VSARAPTRRRPRPFPPSSASSPDLLYRIGRWPDPCGLPPWDATGLQRFDDPQGRFRVLYAAQDRRACFVETLAAFRPPLEADLESLRPAWGGRRPPPLGRIPADWHRRRAVCRLRLSSSSARGFLDLRALRTLVILRDVFAGLLVDLGLGDLDTSGVRGPSRRLTQAIGAWAFDQGYAGIAYKSRFDDAYTCWALFEGRAAWVPAGPPELITRRDPDLRAAATLFGLVLPR
jgi:RES domain